MSEHQEGISDAPVAEPVAPAKEKDSVAYDTYRKTLSEAKKAKAEVEELRKWREEREAAELEKETDLTKKVDYYKTQLSDREQKLKEAEEQRKSFDNERLESTKLAAVLEAVPGSINKDYWGLFDLNQVTVNPDTGEVDKSSVESLVSGFVKKHQRLIDKPATSHMSANSPNAGVHTGSLSVEEWNKLPYAEKIKRKGEVLSQLKN